tara:strand:+ start:317 stop:577 length:261 start_codon:yes stop_codon:yes gene_type:complete
MSSANQRYKASRTSKPFKQWLVEQQESGDLDIHERATYNNATGTKLAKDNTKRNRNILIAIGVGVAIYGIWKYTNKKGEASASIEE